MNRRFEIVYLIFKIQKLMMRYFGKPKVIVIKCFDTSISEEELLTLTALAEQRSENHLPFLLSVII
ncbi:hypothetical protein [[Clostridium] fimetarium]|uniref:hypothetical protein n=1 Tax=[Clostridium] fimetarium TaxID=99656 RepID=UPI000B8645A1|nr:hypothetical protein [[Clostridium] fimetarium]